MNRPVSRPAQTGFGVVELVAAMAVSLTLCAAVLSLVDASRNTAASTTEVSDLQQRLRAALHLIGGELMNAGAGLGGTALAGTLPFPPVVPYRRGQVADDARGGVTFRPAVLSLAYAAGSPAQAEVSRAIDLGGRLRVELRPNCGPLAPVAVCGFVEDMRVVIVEPSGAHDFLTVESVAGADLDLSYRGALASSYGSGRAALAQVVTHSYALRPDAATAVPQLTQYDGFLTERPVADHVVGLSFEYFGEPEPPRLLAAADLGVSPGPWTTYGPAPPPLGEDDPGTAFGPGENCVFTAGADRHEPRLPLLGPPGALVPLTAAIFGDGPWCPDDAAPRRYDADLLRIRRVRVRVRAEVAPRSMRGTAGTLFLRGGVISAARSLAPDQEGVLDITPRNLPTRR